MYDSRFITPLSSGSAHQPAPADGLSLARFAEDLIAAWNDHDPERVAALYAPDFQGSDVAQSGLQTGPRDIRLTTAYYFRAFPDLVVAMDDVVVQGNRLVIAWNWRGTHRGTFMRIPPTGRQVTVRGMTLLVVEKGLIRKSTRIWDLAGLLRLLGLLPDL